MSLTCRVGRISKISNSSLAALFVFALLACCVLLPSRTQALAPGETFEVNGLTYEVIVPADHDTDTVGTAKLIGFNAAARHHVFKDSVRATILTPTGEYGEDYRVTDFSPDAFTGFTGCLYLKDEKPNTYETALGLLPTGGTVGLDIAGGTSKVLEVLSTSSFKVGDTTTSLPAGWSFSDWYLSGSTIIIQNSTADTIPLSFMMRDDDGRYDLPAGESFDKSWTYVGLSNFSYTIGSGSPIAYIPSSRYDSPITITLPATTPRDATIGVDLSVCWGIATGQLVSDWTNDAATVNLSDGTGSVTTTISSVYPSLAPYTGHTATINFVVPERAVWVDGQSYTADYGSPGEPVVLSFAEAVPTLTLTDASLDTTGGDDTLKSVISSNGDLKILLSGGNNTITVDDTQNLAEAITVDGHLEIGALAAGPSDDSRLTIDYAHNMASQALMAQVVDAKSLELVCTRLDIDYHLADGLDPDSTFAEMVGIDGAVEVYGRGASLDMDIDGGVAYGLVSKNGDIAISDALMDISGNERSALMAGAGDITIGGRSQVELMSGPTSCFGTIQCASGELKLDMYGNDTFVHALAAVADASTSTGIVARSIALGTNTSFVAPADADRSVGEVFPDYYSGLGSSQLPVGVWENSSSTGYANAPSVNVLATGKPSSIPEGTTIGSLFDDTLGEWLWTRVLGKPPVYDRSYNLTLDDYDAICACDYVIYSGSAQDLVDSGIEQLRALQFLDLSLTGSGDAVVELPSNIALSYLQLGSTTTSSITVQNTPSLRVLTIGRNSRNDTLESVTLGQGLRSLSSLRLTHCWELRTLDIDMVASQLQVLNARFCYKLAGVDTAACTNLSSLTLAYDDAWTGALELPRTDTLKSLKIDSLAVSSIDFSRVPNLESLRIESCDGVASLDLSGSHALSDLWVSYLSGLREITLADDAPLTSVDIYSTPLSSLTLPETSRLTKLSVLLCNLTHLEIPEASCATLEELLLGGNALVDIDLSGCTFTTFMPRTGGSGIGQNIEMTGAEQADGSVVVDLSAWKDRLSSVTSTTGTYDPQSGKLIFPSKAAAASGFTYELDTGGLVNAVDGPPEVDGGIRMESAEFGEGDETGDETLVWLPDGVLAGGAAASVAAAATVGDSLSLPGATATLVVADADPSLTAAAIAPALLSVDVAVASVTPYTPTPLPADGGGIANTGDHIRWLIPVVVVVLVLGVAAVVAAVVMRKRNGSK